MSNYYAVNPLIGAPTPVTATASSPQFPIGLEVQAVDKNAVTSAGGAAGVFVYARGSNVASAGQFVHIVNGSAVLLASGNIASAYPVGVAAGALTATNVYGWVQVAGRVDYAKCTNHSFAAGIPLFFASTAGYIGSVSGAGSRLFNIVAPVSNHSSLSSGAMTFDLNRPTGYPSTGAI